MLVLDGDGIVLNCKNGHTDDWVYWGIGQRICDGGYTVSRSFFCSPRTRAVPKILLITHFQFKQNIGTMLVGVKEYEIKKRICSETNGVSLGSRGIVIKGDDGVVDKKSRGISDGVGVILDLKCDGENCTRY